MCNVEVLLQAHTVSVKLGDTWLAYVTHLPPACGLFRCTSGGAGKLRSKMSTRALLGSTAPDLIQFTEAPIAKSFVDNRVSQ